MSTAKQVVTYRDEQFLSLSIERRVQCRDDLKQADKGTWKKMKPVVPQILNRKQMK